MKYYRCIRDLFHYKYNGNVYNFRMGQVVPYTPMVQNNLLNFELFGDDFHVEVSKKEELIIEEPNEVIEVIEVPPVIEEPKQETVKRTPKRPRKKPEPQLEVEIEVAEELIPVPKRRARTPKKNEVE